MNNRADRLASSVLYGAAARNKKSGGSYTPQHRS
jgi:hypothetical protein